MMSPHPNWLIVWAASNVAEFAASELAAPFARLPRRPGSTIAHVLQEQRIC